MKNLIFIIILSSFFKNLEAQTHFWTQTQVDTFKGYMGTEVYIFTMESLNDPIVNLKPLMTKKWQGVQTMEIFYTSVTELDFTGVKHDYLEYLRIYKNKDLKTIKGLNKLVNYLNIAIDTNDNLESISFQFDTLNSGSLIHVRNNSKLQSIDVKYTTDFYYNIYNPYYTNFIGYGHGMYIANNPSLRRISYNKTKGDGRLSRLFVINNKSLDSVFFNKVNRRQPKNPNTDTLSSTRYFQFSSLNGFNTGSNYEMGFRLNLSENDSLRYVGAGFENDTFSLVSLTVKNNKSLSNLCVLKKTILNFPNPQSNITLLYDISNNAPGANSIEEVRNSDCNKTNGLNPTDISSHEWMRRWPNPTADRIFFEVKDDVTYQVQITNPMGQVLHQGIISAVNNSIDVQRFPKGLYLVTLKQGTQTQVLKWMVE